VPQVRLELTLDGF